jgi:hypothetical protein
MTPRKARPMRAGRKPGRRMRCGECHTPLTATEWQKHFAHCPKKPKTITR